MKEMLVSIQHSAPCISPFEGITSPFASLFPPPLKGGGRVKQRGMFIGVRSIVIQSEAKNLLSFPGRDSSLRSE